MKTIRAAQPWYHCAWSAMSRCLPLIRSLSRHIIAYLLVISRSRIDRIRRRWKHLVPLVMKRVLQPFDPPLRYYDSTTDGGDKVKRSSRTPLLAGLRAMIIAIGNVMTSDIHAAMQSTNRMQASTTGLAHFAPLFLVDLGSAGFAQDHARLTNKCNSTTLFVRVDLLA
jgi:hypothetical protein